MRNCKKPPKIATFILNRMSDYQNTYAIMGDFEEVFFEIVESKGYWAAWSWYWCQTIITIPKYFAYLCKSSASMMGNYFLMTFRNMKKYKGYSFINIIGLATCIAAFLLIFMYVGFETSYDGFNEKAHQIFRVRNDRIYKNIHDKSAGCPPVVGPTLKKEYPEVEEFARLYNAQWTNPVITYEVPSRPVFGKSKKNKVIPFSVDKIFWADTTLLKMFSFPLLKGTVNALAEPNTAILTESVANKYFTDEPPIGKILTFSCSEGTRKVKITGVTKDCPANSHFTFQVLLSYGTLVGIHSHVENNWGWNAFNTYILLKPGADPAVLEAKLPAMVKKYKNHGPDYRRKYLLQPLTSIHLHSHLRHEPGVNGDIRTINFLVIIAFFIIILSWINSINLSTAHSLLRAREVGLRKVMGSKTRQLIKQFLMESMIPYFLAASLAMMIILVVLPGFNTLVSRPLNFTFLGNKLGLLLAALFSGFLVVGLYPAILFSAFKPVLILKGRFYQTKRGSKLRKSLVLFQFVMSIVLIISTIIVNKQLSFLQNRDLGINMDHTLVIKAPGQKGYNIDKKSLFINKVKNYSFVRGVTFSDSVPGKGYSNTASGIRQLGSHPQKGQRCFFLNIEHNYFRFFQIPLVAGRLFTENYQNEKDAIILNEEAVKLLGFTTPESALHKKIIFGGLEDQVKVVVGVTKNYHQQSLKNPIHPVIFQYHAGKYYSVKLKSKTITRAISQLGEVWQSVFPNQPFDFFFLDDLFNSHYRSDSQFAIIFAIFTILALAINCLGLLGLFSFSTRQRIREISIRKTLGASVINIMRLLLKETLFLVGIANLIAWPISYYLMNQWLQNYAFRTSTPMWIFFFAALLAGLIALVTIINHSLQAALTNPIKNLQSE